MRCIKERYPDDRVIQFAAFVHDIERAYPGRLQKENFASYDDFKKAHAERSAEIAAEILSQSGVSDTGIIDRVKQLVRAHETGGFPEADVLCSCDALSFFRNNIGYFARQSSDEELKQRIRWGLKRLSPAHLEQVSRIEYRDERIRRLVDAELSAIISRRE